MPEYRDGAHTGQGGRAVGVPSDLSWWREREGAQRFELCSLRVPQQNSSWRYRSLDSPPLVGLVRIPVRPSRNHLISAARGSQRFFSALFDRQEAWRRVDDGAEAGHAVVELIEERVLEPGGVVVIPHPPQDIHRQQGYGGEPAYEFVLFGANAMVVPRLLFDPEHESARGVVPGKW